MTKPDVFVELYLISKHFLDIEVKHSFQMKFLSYCFEKRNALYEGISWTTLLSGIQKRNIDLKYIGKIITSRN